jgi:superfamily I DNA and RNA helicase
MFDDASLWRDIGYESEGGMPRGGQDVTLRRRADASPKFFDRIGAPAAVTVAKFDAAEDQYLWLANEIKKNLEVDELEFDDILVISANPIQIRKAASQIMAALQSVNLRSHLAGVTSSVDTVFLPDSIAITSIYRAKGNEAPMVYVVGADYCASGWNLARKRNIFFTAITRSRGWVQISGVGPAMDVVSEEISKVRENAYTLHFDYPTSTQLESIQRLHRDRTKEEIGELTEDLDALSRLVQRIESGEIALDQIPASRRTLVRRLLNRQ